ncbi:DUF4145 domain-containing protein [Clostridium perfringens]|nr:DUF4145 domain-containing protein [Clostridium perfringens]MDK0713209.1 DUF4145 domain-containing protein [Clostridium perfringens]MDU2663757.1 DUF4145 domain-containing protein [Clostridium perfringens]MDU6175684.1 DUF4145 domain-containing protein [Clostridium perfringens]
MKCRKCGSDKNFNQLFESVTYYKEILEDRLLDGEKSEYVHRAYIQNDSIESLCEDFPYVNVTKTLKGMMCLACNEINIIEKKDYYDVFMDEAVTESNIIYPTKNMQIKYEKDIKRIPEKIYNTYIRAREADSNSKDITLILLRKTLEMLLKDINTKGRNLESKINNISEKLDYIENGMHKVRKAGNIAVHEENIDFADSEIQSMAENVETIMKIFYNS